MRAAKDDHETIALLQSGLDNNGLSLELEDPIPAQRLVSLLKRVAADDLERPHDDLDAASKEMYLRSLARLLDVIKDDEGKQQ